MSRSRLYPVKKVIGFDEDLLKAIDAWRRGRTPIPNVSDAIRQILTKHLRQKGHLPKPPKRAGAKPSGTKPSDTKPADAKPFAAKPQ